MHPVAALVRSLVACDHGHWSLQRKVKHSFRGQLDLLALGGCLNSAAQAAAGRRADRCSLAAAGDGSDDGSDASARADFRSGILAAGRTFSRILIGLDVVGLASARNAIKLQHQQRLSRELARALNAYDMALHVGPGRHSGFTLHRQR